MKTILYTLLGLLVLCFICAISYLIYHLFPNVVTNILWITIIIIVSYLIGDMIRFYKEKHKNV